MAVILTDDRSPDRSFEFDLDGVLSGDGNRLGPGLELRRAVGTEIGLETDRFDGDDIDDVDVPVGEGPRDPAVGTGDDEGGSRKGHPGDVVRRTSGAGPLQPRPEPCVGDHQTQVHIRGENRTAVGRAAPGQGPPVTAGPVFVVRRGTAGIGDDPGPQIDDFGAGNRRRLERPALHRRVELGPRRHEESVYLLGQEVRQCSESQFPLAVPRRQAEVHREDDLDRILGQPSNRFRPQQQVLEGRLVEVV